jgi:hypothetical protein
MASDLDAFSIRLKSGSTKGNIVNSGEGLLYRLDGQEVFGIFLGTKNGLTKLVVRRAKTSAQLTPKQRDTIEADPGRHPSLDLGKMLVLTDIEDTIGPSDIDGFANILPDFEWLKRLQKPLHPKREYSWTFNIAAWDAAMGNTRYWIRHVMTKGGKLKLAGGFENCLVQSSMCCLRSSLLLTNAIEVEHVGLMLAKGAHSIHHPFRTAKRCAQHQPSHAIRRASGVAVLSEDKGCCKHGRSCIALLLLLQRS